MRTPQLLSGALVVALASTAACSREETRQEAREVASDARAAAMRAGDQLADSWLTTKIQAQYFADEDIKARHINVSTRDGVVALTGYVDDDRAREQALQIARNTDGVRQVQDRLTIGRAPNNVLDTAGVRDPEPAHPRPTVASGVDAGATTGAVPTSGIERETGAPGMVAPFDDTSIATRIQAKYFLDNSVKARQIAVDARNGVVTLSGEVANDTERAQAVLLARTTEGVQRVEDSLTVNAWLAAEPPPVTSSPPAAPAPTVPSHDAPPEH
jgi:osmotically-inducible protein OsmY